MVGVLFPGGGSAFGTRSLWPHRGLFPVRLDDYIFKSWQNERKVDVTKKVIADARGWESDSKVYVTVRDRLIRDLKIE